jgi:ribosomal-protein-alanine N-acetyltransferase
MRLPKLLIDEMKPEDLDEVMAIEEASFPTPWPRQIFEMELKSKRSFKRVSRIGGVVTGYIIAWMVYDEGHILNIAVHPNFRREGIGETLMRECLDHFSKEGARYAILEVRRSNMAAIKLYEKLGFKSIGVRRGYYTDTGEDAIMMMLTMK